MHNIRVITEILILCGILISIQWTWSIIDVLAKDFKNRNNKIIWILLLIFVPPLGTILYIFMRDNQINKTPTFREINIINREKERLDINSKDERWI